MARLKRLVVPRVPHHVCHRVVAGGSAFVDAAGCFSMVTTERVVYDYTRGERNSPRAAVLDPATLEGKVYAQGLSGWNIPKPLA